MTNTVASGARHRAARQLAHRRPRIQRVVPRIDQAIEPHRSAARAHHADDDPGDLRPGERMIAPRQQRAGERKRQREDGMAEADERQIGGELRHVKSQPQVQPQVDPTSIWDWDWDWELRVEPRDRVRLDSADQVFFHIVDAVRQRARRSARALALPRSCRTRRSNPSARGALTRRALEQRTRRHAWREAARLGELGEQVQILRRSPGCRYRTRR